jgi:hypothetical protein
MRNTGLIVVLIFLFSCTTSSENINDSQENVPTKEFSVKGVTMGMPVPNGLSEGIISLGGVELMNHLYTLKDGRVYKMHFFIQCGSVEFKKMSSYDSLMFIQRSPYYHYSSENVLFKEIESKYSQHSLGKEVTGGRKRIGPTEGQIDILREAIVNKFGFKHPYPSGYEKDYDCNFTFRSKKCDGDVYDFKDGSWKLIDNLIYSVNFEVTSKSLLKIYEQEHAERLKETEDKEKARFEKRVLEAEQDF